MFYFLTIVLINNNLQLFLQIQKSFIHTYLQIFILNYFFKNCIFIKKKIENPEPARVYKHKLIIAWDFPYRNEKLD